MKWMDDENFENDYKVRSKLIIILNYNWSLIIDENQKAIFRA